MAREDVNIKVSANVAEAIQMWKAMEAGPEGMAKSLEGMGSRGKTAAKSIGDDIAGMATKLTGAVALLTGANQALKEMEANAQRAADAVSASISGFGELAQVSETPEEFRMNVAFARGLVQRGIVPAEQQNLAADITGQFLNVVLSPQEMEMMSQIAERRLIAPEGIGGFAQSARSMQRAFGEGEVGSIRDVVNKLIQAGEEAKVKLPGLALAVTEFGAEAAELGIADEESIAAFLAVEQKQDTAVAATSMRSLLTQIQKKGLFRGTLMETLRDVQQQIGPGGNPFAVLEETRAVGAYLRIMKDQGFVAEQQALLESAPARDILGQRLGLIGTDPTLSAAISKESAEGRLASLREEVSAEKELSFDEFRAERQAIIERRLGPTAGGFLNYAEALNLSTLDALGISPRSPITRGVTGVTNVITRGLTGVNIRITGPDGRDVPHETEAAGVEDR